MRCNITEGAGVARYVISTNLSVANDFAFVPPDSYDVVLVPAGVTVSSTGTSVTAAFHLGAANQMLFLDGSAFGYRAVNVTGGFCRIEVGASGLAFGESVGLRSHSIPSGGLTVINHGTVSGGGYGVLSDQALTLTNTGSISGPVAIGASLSADTVTNAGFVIGDCDLSKGDDVFDTSGGQVIGTVFLGLGNDIYTGGAWTDVVVDSFGFDEVALGAGDDRMQAWDDLNGDIFDGGAGFDVLDLFWHDTGVRVDLSRGLLSGGDSGLDLIGGFEAVLGGSGADHITGSKGANVLRGRGGGDSLFGGAGNDRLAGGLGANRLDGGTGNDRLLGGDHVDVLSGGDGDDILHGGYDVDRATGGAGADRFVWRDVEELFANTGTGFDRILDFAPGVDRIDLSAIDPDGTGGDNAFTFVGTGPLTAPGQVVIRQQGGNTFVDISWQTAFAAASIRLDGLLTLSAADFIL
jgi:Ca2+-binding RTX toxin-like protein